MQFNSVCVTFSEKQELSYRRSRVICANNTSMASIITPWPWKSHSRSLKLVSFKSLDAVSYLPSVVTMAVSVAVWDL